MEALAADEESDAVDAAAEAVAEAEAQAAAVASAEVLLASGNTAATAASSSSSSDGPSGPSPVMIPSSSSPDAPAAASHVAAHEVRSLRDTRTLLTRNALTQLEELWRLGAFEQPDARRRAASSSAPRRLRGRRPGRPRT